MKKILILAYSQLNLGDDLLIKVLCERYPRDRFFLIVPSSYKKLMGVNSNNLKLIYHDSLLLKVIKKLFGKNFPINFLIKRVDAIINIGGSIFMENEYSDALFKRANDTISCNNNYFIMGANFGPYKTSIFREQYAKFFSKCSDVCFRDKNSYNLFKDSSTVRVGNDIVFSLKDTNSKKEDYILVSVIMPSMKSDLKNIEKEYYDRLKKLTIECINKNEKIKFISFCDEEKDHIAINKILKDIPIKFNSSISTYNYRGNLNEALKVIKDSKGIIASRFHAVILGFIYNIPVLPIAYNNKLLNILEDISFKGNVVSLNNLKNLTYEKFIQNRVISSNTIKQASSDAEKHFKYLDKFVNNP